MEFKPAQKYIMMMKLRKKGFGTKFLCLFFYVYAALQMLTTLATLHKNASKNDEHN